MRDLLLLAGVAAECVFLFFVMVRLDRALVHLRAKQGLPPDRKMDIKTPGAPDESLETNRLRCYNRTCGDRICIPPMHRYQDGRKSDGDQPAGPESASGSRP